MPPVMQVSYLGMTSSHLVFTSSFSFSLLIAGCGISSLSSRFELGDFCLR